MSMETFFPEVWDKKFLDRLRKDLVYGMVVNRDYEGQLRGPGDTILIPSVSPITIKDYTRNSTNLTPDLLGGAMMPFTPDQQKYFYFGLDDLDAVQAIPGVWDQEIQEASYAMRDTMDIYLSTIIAAGVPSTNTLTSGGTASSATNPIIIGTGGTDSDAYELLVDLNTLMARNKIPSGSRWVVVDPGFAGQLMLDPRFTGQNGMGQSEIIKQGSDGGAENGSLPSTFKQLFGMSVSVSNNVPVTGTGDSAVYTILAGYKPAVTFAEVVAAGKTEAFRLQTGFLDVVRSLCMYGAKVTRPEGLAAAYVQYS